MALCCMVTCGLIFASTSELLHEIVEVRLRLIRALSNFLLDKLQPHRSPWNCWLLTSHLYCARG